MSECMYSYQQCTSRLMSIGKKIYYKDFPNHTKCLQNPQRKKRVLNTCILSHISLTSIRIHHYSCNTCTWTDQIPETLRSWVFIKNLFDPDIRYLGSSNIPVLLILLLEPAYCTVVIDVHVLFVHSDNLIWVICSKCVDHGGLTVHRCLSEILDGRGLTRLQVQEMQ